MQSINQVTFLSSKLRQIALSKIYGKSFDKQVALYYIYSYYADNLELLQSFFGNKANKITEDLNECIRRLKIRYPEVICDYKKVINTESNIYKINTPPSVNNVLVTLSDYSLNLDMSYFTNGYSDAQGDGWDKLVIYPLTNSVNKLKYDGSEVNVNLTIDVEDANNLVYERNDEDIYQEDIRFRISDDNVNSLYSGISLVTISAIIPDNLPPTIGDSTKDIDFNDQLVITVDMLTTETDPQYTDPEGDDPAYLRIDSLPLKGKLELDGVTVLLNQEIPFNKIAQGLLIFKQDNQFTSSDSVEFNFSIQDTGSGQYSS